ncbi:MAG: LolA family protein [Cognatishimia sp.]|uniref:LolA family protein n=1 Tax=Cognatishimia sp. TaxID=2211648 RepID=UPI004058B588
MNRRQFTLATALCAALPMASFGQEAKLLTLEEISEYLNGISAVESSFTQVNWDNSISTGTLLLKRPGRIRLEYDEPDSGLMMAIGGNLAVFDKKSNVPPERYPVRRTPLWLLLQRNVDLTDQKMVVGHGMAGGFTFVEAMDPKRPEYGSIRLNFTSDPVSLTSWLIMDAHGGETFVDLGPLKEAEINNENFNIERMVQQLVPEENR